GHQDHPSDGTGYFGARTRLLKWSSFHPLPKIPPMRGKSAFKKIDRFLGMPLVYFLGVLTGLWPWKDRKPLGSGDRVLVVKLSALGDTLLLLPIYKAIKETVGPKGFVAAIATPIN